MARNNDRDRKILESIRTGNQQNVLEMLYDSALPKVSRYVLRNRGTMEDVQDVFQDAVLVFYTKVKTGHFKEGFDIDGFVYIIARNMWVNKMKENYRFQMEEYPEIADHGNYVEATEKQEVIDAVNALLAELGDPCEKLLKYSVYQSLSLQEIADKMNYTTTNVAKTYVYRCKKKLVKLIENKPSIKQLLKF